MRTLPLYLWKEWRDHRAVLLGMVAAVPLLMVVAGLALPSPAFEDGALAPFAALGCLAIFVFSLTTDLAPGEVRRGTVGFLRRLPAGLFPPFLAKLLVFLLGAALFTAYGWLAAGVTCRLAGGAFPALPGAPGSWTPAIALLWIFAVSCALPRGVLSIPATAGLAVVLAVPVLLLWKVAPGLGLLDWRGAAPLAAAGGVVAAWLAFARGRRFADGSWRPARLVVAAGALCALPWWGDAAREAWAWHFHAEPLVREAYVGEGGRYLFVNRYRLRPGKDERGNRRYAPLGPVVVDLASGAVREAGAEDRWFAPATQNALFKAQGVLHRYLRFGDAYWDARTAQPADPDEDELLATARAVTPWRRGGRPVWEFDGRLEADDGVLEERWHHFTLPCGTGAEFEWRLYDFERGRSYARRDLALGGHRVYVRPGRWLVHKPVYGSRIVYELLDPDANSLAPARGLAPGDSLSAVHDDGRLFVMREGALRLVDPETGVSVDVETPAWTKVLADQLTAVPKRTPGGKRVYWLYGDNRTVFARFDDDDLRLVTADGTLDAGWCQLIACPSEDEALVNVGDSAIWRVRFGSTARQEVYRPR